MLLTNTEFLMVMAGALWVILVLKILSEGFESRRQKQLRQEIRDLSLSCCPNCCTKSTENEVTLGERQQST